MEQRALRRAPARCSLPPTPCQPRRRAFASPAHQRQQLCCVRRHCRVAAAFQTPPPQEQQATDVAPAGRKLGRFSPKNDIRLGMVNFRYEAEVEAGTLIIRPLTEARLGQATDLLTDTFAATDDVIGLYSRYMRGQIRQYLENHLRIVPDAIVLIATLRPRSQQLTAAAAATSSPGRVNGSNGAAADSAAASPPAPASAADSAALAAATKQQPNGSGAGNGAAPLAGEPSQQGDNRTADGAAGSAAVVAATRSASWWQSRTGDDEGVLVGTVEMAFTEATRTKFLTLNPPRDSAYLGNMCTAPLYRRRGYGTHLLRAAERLTRIASYPVIYLHLRFKDKEAAAMYENAGFTEVKRDSFIRSVVGLDRRFLMSKAVARSVDNES